MAETSRWITLDGAVNVRDLGGLPAAGGRLVRPDRLIRADNLQGLSPADVRQLVDGHGVRQVVDLRTGVEVRAEGPGPITREPDVTVHHFSLFPEAGENTDVVAADADPDDDTDTDTDSVNADTDTDTAQGAPPVLPWHSRRTEPAGAPGAGASGVYVRYLDDRADSVLAALRVLAYGAGATLVHCAAGKDRTGVVVAVALAEVGVPREEIIADYALSAERIDAILARLSESRTYANDIDRQAADRHRPRATTMQRLLDALDERYGGAGGWLRSQGWTDEDAAALRARLLD